MATDKILYIVLGTNCLQQIDSNLWIEDFQPMEKLLRCVHSPATMDVLLTRYMKHMIEKPSIDVSHSFLPSIAPETQVIQHVGRVA